MNKPSFSEKESLDLITEMISRARNSFNENGAGPILWGAVVGFCGLFQFTARYFEWNVPFDVWLLTLVALIPQAIITYRENRLLKAKNKNARILDAVWLVYGLSVFALVAYFNLVGPQSDRLVHDAGFEYFMRKPGSSTLEPLHLFPLSAISLLILLFAFPTLVTGLATSFLPMTIGGILSYVFFLISIYTTSDIDNLLAGITGIINWLIPGIILRSRYKKQIRENV